MTTPMTVTARVPEKKDETGNTISGEMIATITVQMAESLDEAREMFGEEAVLTNAAANWRVTLQSNIRSSLKAGLTPAQIQDKLGSAVLGVAQVGTKVDPVAAYAAKFKMATPEEQLSMIEELKALAAAN